MSSHTTTKPAPQDNPAQAPPGFKTYEKVKLQVDLTCSLNAHKIIISQETAPHFKKWIYEA